MVTNLENGKSTEVAINDRGPFLKERILDLSYAAATTLGMIGPGTIPVRIEVLDGGPQRVDRIRERLDYTLQLGSFADIDNARKVREQVGKAVGQRSEINVIPFETRNGTYYRVRVGTFSDRSAAEDEARRLAGQGFPVIIMEK
jgi:rare lipoprotein A